MNETMKIIFGLVGGLAIFIYGMNMMSECLQKAAGEKMKKILALLTKNPILGVLAGALTTAVLQSSSATTVMTIGFVSAGLMSLPQAISIILGANIGTTMTAQIIAFKITDYIYLFIFAGFLISFISKKEKVKNIGQTIFAFGLLFLGIETMGDVMKPLASSAFFVNMIGKVSHIPILGVCVGAVMTLVVQSSSATIAVLQNFAAQAGPDGVTSIIGLTGAIPILLGDNIGTTITAVLASIGQPKDARRTAFAHCVFNISGAILFLFLVKPYAALIQFISPKGNEIDVISRQIANAHTGFNLVMTLIWIPLIPLMVKIVMKLVPDGKGKETEVEVAENPKYLDNKLIAQPAAALQLVAKEVMYCAKLVEEMIGKLQYRNGKIDKENAELVEENAKILQKLYASVNDYFASLYSGGVLTEEQASQSAGMQSILCDIDRIGQLTREIMETVAKQNKGKHKYSKEALKELKKAMEQIQMIYGSCIRAISGNVDMDIKELMRQKEDIMQLDEKMRKNHIARVGKGKCDSKLTIPFNDVLHNIDRIGNSCVNLVEVAKENVTMQAFFAED
ncbi:MAG: Na/Pi cotransporter family protein [Agathobacter sp.]|nr:Na/Pi cotransporter family protein [Agathobacter sp.]